MDINKQNNGWLSSTKSFFSGVAKEVSSLVVPIPEQPKSNEQISSPLGGQTYQQNGGYQQPPQPYGMQPQQQQGYPSQQQQPSYPGQQPSPTQGDYLSQQQPGGGLQVNPNAPPSAAFPTSHFPTSPPNALSQQLQPLNHPNYAASHHQQHQHPTHHLASPPPPVVVGGNVHNISEFTGIHAVTGSTPQPSPSPPPPSSFGAPYNPLMTPSSYPLQPTMPSNAPPATFPSTTLQSPPASNLNTTTTPFVHPAPPRRVLDENSINPSLSAPQPNLSYPQQPSSSGGYVTSPGRILSPAFQSGLDPNQPQSHPYQQAQPHSQQPPPSMGGLPNSSPSSSSGGGLLPPPPPVSSYWKQRAAQAGPEQAAAESTSILNLGHYSDLDKKSMDFSYNNRYERPAQELAPHPAQQPPSSLSSSQPFPSQQPQLPPSPYQQYNSLSSSQPLPPVQPPQQQQNDLYGQQQPSGMMPPPSAQLPYRPPQQLGQTVPAYPPPQQQQQAPYNPYGPR